MGKGPEAIPAAKRLFRWLQPDKRTRFLSLEALGEVAKLRLMETKPLVNSLDVSPGQGVLPISANAASEEEAEQHVALPQKCSTDAQDGVVTDLVEYDESRLR